MKATALTSNPGDTPSRYCNMLCGVLRGALEQIGMMVDVSVAKDMLRGDELFELRLTLRSHEPETYPFKDDE